MRIADGFLRVSPFPSDSTCLASSWVAAIVLICVGGCANTVQKWISEIFLGVRDLSNWKKVDNMPEATVVRNNGSQLHYRTAKLRQ